MGTNADLARQGVEAALRGDLDAIGELLDPEVKWNGGDPAAEGACRNRAQALEFMRAARGRLVEVVERADGALVANVSTFRDGKVVEMVHYPDPDAARTAVA